MIAPPQQNKPRRNRMKTPDDLGKELVAAGDMLRGRRNVLKAGMLAGAASAAGALALGLGRPAKALAAGGITLDKAGDAKILNVALGLEFQAIHAYDVAAGTGLLTGAIKDVALLFQAQHKEHAKIEEDAIRALGGTPVARKDKYDLGDLSTIKTDKDLLAFALGL